MGKPTGDPLMDAIEDGRLEKALRAPVAETPDELTTAEAERCAKRLWLYKWMDDRIRARPDSDAFDRARALRLVRRVPPPVNVDTDMSFTHGQPCFHAAAQQRAEGFVDELVDLLAPDKKGQANAH